MKTLCFGIIACLFVAGLHVYDTVALEAKLTEVSSVISTLSIVFLCCLVMVINYKGRLKSKLNVKSGEFEIDKDEKP